MTRPRTAARTSALSMPRAFFGRVLLGAAAIAFGVEYALASHTLDGLPPLPWFVPHATIAAAILSVFLPVLGVAVVARFHVRESAALLGAVFLLGALPHLMHLSAVLHEPDARNRFLIPVALASAAVVLSTLALEAENHPVFLIARALFAFILIAFGVNHFAFTGAIATQLPDWIILHMLCVRFTGGCLIAAGVAILTGYVARPAAMLLAVMFAVWLLLLDVPALRADRLDANARIHVEVMVALIGAALLMATSPKVPSLHHSLALEPAR